MKHVEYRAALYLRLSRDDEGAGDSGSIKTQQMMLERYCKEQNLLIHNRYIDDGYSGLHFDRPAFQRMLADIEQGCVNLVITKDLSRLGRDYLQTGYYTEQYFPLHGVRYVALNDGVDTLCDNNDIAPFKNILNDMYAKDLSRKVKSAKRARAAQGAFTGSHAPYGYRKKPGDSNVLEVDEETAPMVREIYRMALNGLGAGAIARRLREEKVLTPAAVKVQRGERHFAHLFAGAPEDKRCRWAYSTVHRILRDRVYLGHMVGHKSQVDHYKTKRRSLVAEDEQIVVKNTHPPLVTQDAFNRVQQCIRVRRAPTHGETENLFQALLYCAECGHPLSMATKVSKNRRTTYYRCMHHYRFPHQCAGSHYIRFDHLYCIVLREVQIHMQWLCGREESVAERLQQWSGEEQTWLCNKQGKLRSRLAAVDTIIGRLYEDFAAARVTGHNYGRLLAKYQQEQDEILRELESLQNKPVNQKAPFARLGKLRDVVERHLYVHDLTAPLLQELIRKIHVGQRERQDGLWTQDIRMEYRFAPELPET